MPRRSSEALGRMNLMGQRQCLRHVAAGKERSGLELSVWEEDIVGDRSDRTPAPVNLLPRAFLVGQADEEGASAATGSCRVNLHFVCGCDGILGRTVLN